MTEENETAPSPRESLKLKLAEPVIVEDSPWVDDVLDRVQIAGRLTNLIRTQAVPFVVGLDGYWGTGKTFMLKRWQKDLESQGFQAIYFNAWEDDFCDDPLLAIIGQLSEYFEEDDDLGDKARRAFETAMPLLRQNAISITTGLLERHIGISGLSLEVKHRRESNRDLLQEYRDQRATKADLKEKLTELSINVMETTGHPLVFVIDELDRCRPTFAIELLERVKHIFDVPNLVFVFGINRDELCSSLKSMYGDIEADIYLRRFFDMEFSLPQVDAESFCRHLFAKFELDEYFLSFSQEAGSNLHHQEFRNLSEHLLKLWAHLGLSLRDLDYCVRLMAMVGKNLNAGNSMYPSLIGVLIPFKFKNPDMYRKFMLGQCMASDLLNDVCETLRIQGASNDLSQLMDVVEADLYLTDKRFDQDGYEDSKSLQQLDLLLAGSELTQPEYLSERIKGARRQNQERVQSIAGRDRRILFPANTVDHLAELIDLHQHTLKR